MDFYWENSGSEILGRPFEKADLFEGLICWFWGWIPKAQAKFVLNLHQM